MKGKRVTFSLTFALATVLVASLFLVLTGKGQTHHQNQTAKILRRSDQSPGPPTAKELDDAATPIVELNDPKPVSSDRMLKNKNWDKHNLVESNPDPRAAAVLIDHWEGQGISDFPTDISDLVVEGKVTDAAAFLSNDKGDVYSEFAVQITDVLRAAPDSPVRRGDSIVTQRSGGRVKYPDGRIVRYGFVGQGSPSKGTKYLFFLSKSEQGDYKILTGYEIQANTILALDGSRINHRGLGRWSFDKHNGEDYQVFRKAVEHAIANPPERQKRRVGE